MNLENLQKIKIKRKAKRVGRGYGSGRGGHTSGRGSKGQKARGKVRPYFEGGQLPLVKRLPHKSGFRSPTKKEFRIFNINFFNRFKNGQKITVDYLKKEGLIKNGKVKILGNGSLIKRLKFEGFKYSKTAKQKIEALKGTAK